MQIVIDTRYCPCRTLKDECGIGDDECCEDDIYAWCPLIRNGGVKLPKGHGDLIDRNELLKEPIDLANYPSNYVKIAKTIIEADNTESEK